MAYANNMTNVKQTAKKLSRKADRVFGGEVKEGVTTKAIEHQTGKLPSLTWLNLAIGSMAASAIILAKSERKEFANFVGLWAPCFMLIGVYNKLVKLEEQNDKGNAIVH